jgi:hypothetical protein
MQSFQFAAVATFFIGAIQVSFLGTARETGLGFIRKSKDKRRSSRRKLGASAWIRVDGVFAVQPCKVHNISNDGVLITIDRAENVSSKFVFMLSREGGSGWRARVKWRRGSQIGAIFI